MKRFIKNKKGAAHFVEFIILIPFIMYAFFYSYYAVIGYTMSGIMQDNVDKITRELIAADNVVEGLDNISTIVYDGRLNSSFKIKQIIIDSKDSGESFSLDFGDGFANYIEPTTKKFKKEQYLNDYGVSSVRWTAIQNAWAVNNTVTVTLYTDMADNIMKDAITFSIYDPVSEQKISISPINNTIVEVFSRMMISNEEVFQGV